MTTKIKNKTRCPRIYCTPSVLYDTTNSTCVSKFRSNSDSPYTGKHQYNLYTPCHNYWTWSGRVWQYHVKQHPISAETVDVRLFMILKRFSSVGRAPTSVTEPSVQLDLPYRCRWRHFFWSVGPKRSVNLPLNSNFEILLTEQFRHQLKTSIPLWLWAHATATARDARYTCNPSLCDQKQPWFVEWHSLQEITCWCSQWRASWAAQRCVNLQGPEPPTRCRPSGSSTVLPRTSLSISPTRTAYTHTINCHVTFTVLCEIMHFSWILMDLLQIRNKGITLIVPQAAHCSCSGAVQQIWRTAYGQDRRLSHTLPQTCLGVSRFWFYLATFERTSMVQLSKFDLVKWLWHLFIHAGDQTKVEI